MDFESERAVGIKRLCNPPSETAKSNVIVKLTASTEILTLEIQA